MEFDNKTPNLKGITSQNMTEILSFLRFFCNSAKICRLAICHYFEVYFFGNNFRLIYRVSRETRAALFMLIVCLSMRLG